MGVPVGRQLPSYFCYQLAFNQSVLFVIYQIVHAGWLFQRILLSLLSLCNDARLVALWHSRKKGCRLSATDLLHGFDHFELPKIMLELDELSIGQL